MEEKLIKMIEEASKNVEEEDNARYQPQGLKVNKEIWVILHILGQTPLLDA